MMNTVCGRLPVVLTLLSILCASRVVDANPVLPVLNGCFENYSGVNPKAKFGAVMPDHWSIARPGSLTYVCDPNGHVDGTQISVWPGLPPTSPCGGNFVLADGDSAYSSSFSQTIFGLTPGATYDLPLYQAAGQEINFSGPTTEWWEVSLTGTFPPQTTPVMNTPSHGFVPWHPVTLTFTVSPFSNGTEVLTFLAMGTPNGIPPVAFLDCVGVCVPEPSSLVMVGIGLIVSVAVARFRAKSAQV